MLLIKLIDHQRIYGGLEGQNTTSFIWLLLKLKTGMTSDLDSVAQAKLGQLMKAG